MPPKREKPFSQSSTFYRKLKRAKQSAAGNEQDPLPSTSKADNTNPSDSPVGVYAETIDEKKADNTNPSDSPVGVYAETIDEKMPDVEMPDAESDDKQINEDDYSKEILELENDMALSQDLKGWCFKYAITHAASNELLKILRKHGHNNIPKDSRTLLETPKSIEIMDIGNGKMWYNGVKQNLTNLVSRDEDFPEIISLDFNIDGMSPFNSSMSQFWPILFLIHEMRHIPPMVAAVFYGESKPPLELYLGRFVDDLNDVIENGLMTPSGKNISVTVRCFICDTQARSFILGTPACNAECGSCLRCEVEGEWDHKGRHMSYPRFDCTKRTDLNFREKSDQDHHKQDTPLTKLPINMVEDFVVADSLHLLDLGIMRRCLYGWREGSYNFKTKLSKKQVDSLSESLEKCNEFRPIEIQRSIRGMKNLKFWKGTEYRVFLLYLGAVVLKDVLPTEVYKHFLILMCAVTILSCEKYLKSINVADTLLKEYLEKFIELYGIDSISSNLHNLSHVIDDVKKFGALPTISAYPFENFLGHLKSLVRHGNLPLSQIAKRIIELFKANLNNISKQSGNIELKNKNEEGCYSQVKFREFILSDDKRNRYFMSKSRDIVVMEYAKIEENKIYVYGYQIVDKHDFFKEPMPSSSLNIFSTTLHEQSKSHIGNLQPYALDDIKCKLFCVPYQNKLVFFPLLHTLK